MKQQTAKILVILFVLGLVPQFHFAYAQTAPDPTFNPSMLIPDAAFSDVGTFGSAEGIQKFLEQKGSVLANTSPEFLAKLKEPDSLTKVGLEDPQPSLTRLRTAAELIYDAGRKWGLNPQVILVLLQKEQSLISGSFSTDTNLQRALDRAVGFGCPDYEGCGDIFLGFYRQLFGSFDSGGSRWLGAAASLMKSFNTEVGGVRVGRGPGVDANNTTFGRPIVRTSRKGDVITLDNTLGGYVGVSQNQTVTLGNFATAALYRYTPHVFNGNYNFWKFYTAWFKYPNGTVIQRVGDTGQYVIDNGMKRLFSPFVAQQRKINTSNVILVSQTEFDSYPTEKPLAPLDGTLVKGDADSAIYYVSSSIRHPVSYPVFVQRGFSFGRVVTLPQAEVVSYEQGSFLPPLGGTLVLGTTSATVYLIEGSLKRPISYSVFVARKYSFAKIMPLADSEISSLTEGPFLTPPEQTAFKSDTSDQVWWYRDNAKHSVTAFVWQQRSVGSFPFLILSDGEINAIPTGLPLAPKDGTVIKSDTSTAIYRMEGGFKRLFTETAYRNARYPKPTILSQSEVDLYPQGLDILK